MYELIPVHPRLHRSMTNTTVGVLALQGAFLEHINLLKKAAIQIATDNPGETFTIIQVRNEPQLARCDALIIPGGESTTISFVAAQSNLLEPLRNFVKCVVEVLLQNLARVHSH